MRCAYVFTGEDGFAHQCKSEDVIPIPWVGMEKGKQVMRPLQLCWEHLSAPGDIVLGPETVPFLGGSDSN
jgi:hypothetical protein